MLSFQDRRKEIVSQAANRAMKLPYLESGYWFHGDIRDNMYYSIHLIAAVDLGLADNPSQALQKAEDMLLKVLRLQVRDTESDMYGHWPLKLQPTPETAKPNNLPVELTGCLWVFFLKKYGSHLSEELRNEMETSLRHVYESPIIRFEAGRRNHHESKLTTLKLLLGYHFEDKALYDQAFEDLKALLAHVQNNGMAEYGALPWFWHWVQAMTFGWETIEASPVKQTFEGLLEFLWGERAQFYWKGAWIGPQSREQLHDVPLDSNTLLDYIQFGDFPCPAKTPRLEAAGLLEYLAPASIRDAAVNRPLPATIRKLVPPQWGKPETDSLHTYTYLTEDFALGGVWERSQEFDNEQRRWKVTFPLTLPIGEIGSNQIFFFHPGDKWTEGDLRHESPYCAAAFEKSVAVALYPIPEDGIRKIVGTLPKGNWIFNETELFGQVGNAYLAIFFPSLCTVEEKADRFAVESAGDHLGIVLEAVSAKDAEAADITSLQEFAKNRAARKPNFRYSADGSREMGVRYAGLSGDTIDLEWTESATRRLVNGSEPDFTVYVK